MTTKIVFQVNVPVELALKSIAGKLVPSQFAGGDQYLFITTDDRLFYVRESVGEILMQQFADLNIQPGDVVRICKGEFEAGRGRKQIRWVVTSALPSSPRRAPGSQSRVAPIAPRPTGTYGAAAQPMTAALPQAAVVPAVVPSFADLLLDHTKTLVDVYVQACQYAATQHGGTIKPDMVQSAMITAFISLSKNSSVGFGQ
jgi:hypothetical protein